MSESTVAGSVTLCVRLAGIRGFTERKRRKIVSHKKLIDGLANAYALMNKVSNFSEDEFAAASQEISDACNYTMLAKLVLERSEWSDDMSKAPKDKPILAMCREPFNDVDPEVKPYVIYWCTITGPCWEFLVPYVPSPNPVKWKHIDE